MAGMPGRIGRLLEPAPFEGVSRDYVARTLPAVLWAATWGALASLALALAASQPSVAAGVAASAAVLLVALVLVHRGRLRLASLAALGDGLVLATYLVWTGEGIRDVAVLVYPVLLIVGGMLLDGPAFGLLFGLCVGSLALAAFGRAAGQASSAAALRALGVDCLYIVVVLAVTAAAVRLLAAALRRSLKEAHASQTALAASEERYRQISELTSDYAFSTRLGADGRLHINWVAGAFEKITGYSLEEYVARGGWAAALHPDDVEQDARDLREVHANRPVVTEVRTIARSGDVRWVRVYAHPIWNQAEDRLEGLYGAVQDVTERRRAAAEREALVRELEARNAELERFTYTVSHDLKSPLITVQSFLTFLEQDAVSGNFERLREDVARIKAAADRMQRLLKELLELSRIGRVASPPVEVPFAEIAREAVALARGRLDRAAVVVELARDLPTVWGDRTRLVEAMQNLLDNAAKFMGGQPRPRVEVGARREDERTVLFVRDNGIGIDPRHHLKVFGLFEKLDPQGEGTGIGLAVVKRIVETHGGTVWVESQGRGHGTTFCFTLASKPHDPAREPAESEALPFPDRRREAGVSTRRGRPA
jgi:PAS domain S-box-containing protein